MKKLFAMVFCVAVVFGFALNVQAGFVDFESPDAWNSNPPYVTNEWEDQGVVFEPGTQGPDGGLYDAGVAYGLGWDGQLLIVDGTVGGAPVPGTVMLFPDGATSFSFEYARGNGSKSSATAITFYVLDASEEAARSIAMPLNGAVNEVMTLTWDGLDDYGDPFVAIAAFPFVMSGGYIYGIDNLNVETPAVPIPASVLLLGTGLLPLLRLRKKS